MKTKKTIDLGEYIVDISYEKETGYISVEIYDETEELIESIVINNSSENNDINPNLN
jgi:hypothetical protein